MTRSPIVERLPRECVACKPADVFQHDFNVHINSIGLAAIDMPDGCASIQPLASPGIREILGNVFDIQAGYYLDPLNFTIHSNYFGDRFGTGQSNVAGHTWNYFQNNFRPRYQTSRQGL